MARFKAHHAAQHYRNQSNPNITPTEKKLNPGPQVEAEGAARRKAEARALEAEGRVQVL